MELLRVVLSLNRGVWTCWSRRHLHKFCVRRDGQPTGILRCDTGMSDNNSFQSHHHLHNFCVRYGGQSTGHNFCVRRGGQSTGVLRCDTGMSDSNYRRPGGSVREVLTGVERDVQDDGSAHVCTTTCVNGSAGVFLREGDRKKSHVLASTAQCSALKPCLSAHSLCLCKSLWYGNCLRSSQRGRLQLPVNVVERSFSERAYHFKVSAQCFHTGGSRESEQETDAPLTLATEDDLDRLTQQVIKKASEVDVMVGSVSVRQVEQLVLGLHQCGWDAAHILSLLSSHPSLIHHHHAVLPIIHLLFDHGFELQLITTILHRLPSVVNVSRSHISEVIDALRNVNVHEKSIVRIVARNPALLLATKTALHQRVMALRQLFKTADVITLSMNCPQVLTDDWKDIQARFDYIFHEMNVSQKQMVHASLFNHSLLHIKTRHAFLVRAGLFLMAKRREGEKNPNATLDEIIASSDKAFCKKFGGFQVEEYRVFCQLFEKEQAAYQDSASDSEDEKS